MTCLFVPGSDQSRGAEPFPTSRRAENRFTLFRLLRAFLALNLVVGICVLLNSARAETMPESFIIAGPLWLVASRNFSEISLWYLGVTVVLAGTMSTPLILFRWWSIVPALAAAAYWLSIGIWVAMVASC